MDLMILSQVVTDLLVYIDFFSLSKHSACISSQYKTLTDYIYAGGLIDLFFYIS